MNKTLSHVVTILLAGLVLVLGAPAAAAHKGPIKLEVHGDGGHNVNVLVTWKKDGHPVTDVVVATLVATAADGRSFGPVQLMSSPEGQNLYRLAEPLPSGEWNVTVTATKPSKARATAKVKAQEIAAAPVAATMPDKAAATSASDAEGVTGMALKIGLIALAALLAVGVMVVLYRRKALYARR